MLIARPTHGGLIFLLLTCAAGGVAFMNVGLMTALCASALAGIWISAFVMAQFSFLFIVIRDFHIIIYSFIGGNQFIYEKIYFNVFIKFFHL